MKIEPENRWVKETDCGTPLEIVGYNHVEHMLYLRSGLELLQMNLYGKNFNYLYNVLGNETDNWISKKITLKQELLNGKNVRTIISAK